MLSLSKFHKSKKRPLNPNNFSVNPKRNARLKNRNRNRNNNNNSNNNNNNSRFNKTARTYDIPNISKEFNEFEHTSVTTNNHTIFLVLNVHGIIQKNLDYNKNELSDVIQMFEPDEDENIDFVSQIIYGKYLCPNYYIDIDLDYLKKELLNYCLFKGKDNYLNYATNKMTSFEFMELCKHMFATKYMMQKGYYKIKKDKYDMEKMLSNMFPNKKYNSFSNNSNQNTKEFLENQEKYPYYDRIFKDIFDNFIINTYNPDPNLTLIEEGNNFLINKKYSVNLKFYHTGKKNKKTYSKTDGDIPIIYCSGGSLKNEQYLDLKSFTRTTLILGDDNTSSAKYLFDTKDLLTVLKSKGYTKIYIFDTSCNTLNNISLSKEEINRLQNSFNKLQFERSQNSVSHRIPIAKNS